MAVDTGPVLALAAYPGDEVFGCGGTLALHAARGHAVAVLVLSDGAEDPAVVEACRAAGACLGYQGPEVWSLPASPFVYDESAVRRLIQALQARAPARLYAPGVDDPDPRRAKLGLTAREALRRAGVGGELAVYELGSPMPLSHVVGITETLDLKRRAMSSLDVRQDAEPLMRQTLALDAVRAFGLAAAGSDAEGFRLTTAARITDTTPGLSRPRASDPAHAAHTEPLVSIIVRTANRDTLDQALDSIAAQTYRGIEVILVDVQGRDQLGRPERCGEFAMRTASAGAPLRRGAAANLGLSQARGDYILFLDDDDWLLPEHIAGLVEAVRGGEGAAAAYAGVVCRGETPDGDWPVLHTFNAPYDPLRLLIENYLPIHAVLFARRLLGESLGFDERLDVYEDWDFWLQLSALTPLIHVDHVSAVYRIAHTSGFGLREDDEQLDPGLAAIFEKWRPRWTLEQLLGIVDYAKHRSMYEELREESARKHAVLSEQLSAATFDLEQWKMRHSILAADKRAVEQQIATLHERILSADARRRSLESAREADRELLEILGVQSLTDAFGCRDELARYRSLHGRFLKALALVGAPFRRPYRLAKAVLGRIRRPLVRWVSHARNLSQTAQAYGLAVVVRSLLCKRRRSRPCQEPSIRDLWLVLELASIGLEPNSQPVVTILLDPTRVAPDSVRLLKALAQGHHVPPFELLLHYPKGHPILGPLKDRLPGLRRVPLDGDASAAQAVSAALAASAGDWLLLLSCVNIEPNDWLARMIQTAQDTRLGDAPAGGVCVKVMGTDGRLVMAGSLRTRDGAMLPIGAGQDILAPEYNFLRKVDAGSDACFLLSRQALLDAGGDRLAAAVGVEDLCAAMQTQGWTLLYQPEVTAVIPAPLSRAPAHAGLMGHARRRLLVVDAVMLTPDQDSGSLRMFNLLETFLEQDWHVTFAPSNLEYGEPYGPLLQRRGIEVLHAPQTPSIQDFLRRRGAEYDLVILSRVLVASALLDATRLHAPQARLWFDTVDLHFLREQREADLRGDPAASKLAEQRKRQELDLMRRADLTLVVSHIEQDLLAAEVPEVRVEILSNIHDLHPTHAPFEARDAILFIGGFNHDPNVDAVRYYVQEVLPLVQAEIGQVPTFIIGSRPTREVLALDDPERGLHVTGYVEDVTPYFERARLSIAPLRYGAGVKGKINMSMAYGVPVVATACAAEGMFLTPGEDILVGEDGAAFAAAVTRLYSDPALWARLSAQGLTNIEQHFSRQTARATLARLLAEPWA